MGRKPSEELPRDLKELQERVEEWRRTRTKQGGMPEELWQAAVSLVENYTVYRVSSVLRVSFDTLKKRANPVKMLPPQAKGDAGKGQTAQEGQFVSVTPQWLFGRGDSASLEIEMEGADGAKMTMRWTGEQGVDVITPIVLN